MQHRKHCRLHGRCRWFRHSICYLWVEFIFADHSWKRTMQKEPDVPLRYTYLAATWDVWIFHFPSRYQITIRCPQNNAWLSSTQTLSGAGIIRNVTMCFIASEKIRILPELHGTTHAQLDALSMYIPDELPILATHKTHHVKAALTADLTDRDHLKSHLEAFQISFDMDTLFYIQQSTLRQQSQPHCHQIVAAISCAITVLLILYFSLWSNVHYLTPYCFRMNTSPKPNTTPQT